jgi:hypothetical protein
VAANPNYAEAVQEALARRRSAIVRISGYAMYPLLKHGTQVEVQPTALESLRPGDLIVFNNGREVICRRLLRVRGRLCWVKGDASLSADPPVTASQVMGRVTRMVDANYRIHFLDTPERARVARAMARFSYLYAFWYRTRRRLRNWPWTSRGIEWFD